MTVYMGRGSKATYFPITIVGMSKEYPTYQIIGDNVDLHQRASHQSMDRRNNDHHWFHLYAVKDRITGIDLPNDSPVADVAHLPLHIFLPTVEECNTLQNVFGVLIAHVITDKISYLHPCKDVVSTHIPHKYSNAMKQKSEMVS